MSRANDPAFPTSDLSKGLTKREHFAGLAMQGLLAQGADEGYTTERNVKKAREYADALIDELAKPTAAEPLLIEARQIIHNLTDMVDAVPGFRAEKYDSFRDRVEKFMRDTIEAQP